MLAAYREYRRSQPGEYTGFREPSLERLAKMMIYLVAQSREQLYKVKLMKLLFYADFLHYARQGVSISGFPYARLEMGPVPDNFQHVWAWIETAATVRTNL